MSRDISALLKGAKRIHFIGIGGSGMFPLVEILHCEGYEISGSDVNEGSIIDLERKLGLKVSIPHDASNVDGADAVVVTAALLDGNPEVARALQLGLPIIERAELLGWVTSRYSAAVCISGTHGKTTTSSMLTSMLMLAGKDPSAVIGGKLPLIGGYGRSGRSEMIVCEACEFKNTFLHLSPDYAVILNVDADHLDFFKTFDNVKAAFNSFARLASKSVVANGDDQNTFDALKGVEKDIIYFGESPRCRFRISDIESGEKGRHSFTLSDGEKEIGRFSLSVPGRQNVSNAAAAATCAHLLGLTALEIQDGFDSFHGAGRRFEILGEWGGVTIADDYAHHPAELEVNISAAKDMGFNRVIAVFQPFTYSRTKLLLDDFARVLSKADKVIMTEIMGSREVNTFGISTADLARKIPGSEWYATFEKVADRALEAAAEGDLIITLGCGDIYKAANIMVKKCKSCMN